MTEPTEPTGVSFVSYRRARLEEATLLVSAQHDHGIPTWQDIANLGYEPTEDELRRILNDPTTANVLLWVTPEIENSTVVLTIEVPVMKERKDRGDGFFIVPVAAGGLDYGRAAEIVSAHIGLDDFSTWNFAKSDDDPITEAEAGRIAREVLKNRLGAIDIALDEAEPFTLGIWTRHPAPDRSGDALQLNWKRHFDGRFAIANAWEERLLPALDHIVDAICAQDPRRRVIGHGQPSIVAALALGAAFLEPCGVGLSWMQKVEGQTESTEWSLTGDPEPSQISKRFVSGDSGAEDLVVAISLRADVEPAIKRGRRDGTIPAFRGAVVLEADEDAVRLETPGQALDAVEKTVQAIREAKKRWPTPGTIHLFMAAPAGFAVMLGQKLNALGPVQTYEHDPTDGIGHYRPAVLLRPGC